MVAWEYPITQLYGYDPSYPLNNGYHKGVDYGCPDGTPVTVNGVTIGLSGHTGAVYGSHLHVGHWKGGTSVASNPQDGKTVSGAVVSEVKEDATNGKYVRVADADGSSWVYLHLSQQLVSVGQKLEGGIVEPADYKVNDGDIQNYFKNFLGRDATEADKQVYRGKTHKDIIYAIIGSGEFQQHQNTGFTPVTEQLFKKGAA